MAEKNQAIRPRANGKGKQVKRFLNNEAALLLAANIGDQVEAKASHRIDMRKPQQVTPTTKKPSASKTRLKEKKAAIIEERAKQKRKRLEVKKSAIEPAAKAESKPKSMAAAKPEKKRVSFA
ncbi:hypothetical protein CYLTODRAFT_495110 [Cylindrobasidium torrendii FP15055 ss-10]|uniref:Uncharacterized protein n=1 Tax=Cylindrobasidium torrendii FP15055 ss-10 TaxID=1314674 RepID=A0A0D7AU37_9AGAR|nr:hypothetical protein CYLTODRAFT_495110 [Cylindrobasidium torrendii FP15055 ss-10]